MATRPTPLNARPLMLGLAISLTLISSGLAQMPPPAGGPGGPGHEPPPQAYEDCKGKKDGDAVQHQTPQGMVAAKCLNSPKGLVARPDRPPPGMPGPDQMRPDQIRPDQMPPPK